MVFLDLVRAQRGIGLGPGWRIAVCIAGKRKQDYNTKGVEHKDSLMRRSRFVVEG